MQTSQPFRPDRRLHFLWWLALSIGTLALAALLSHGTSGGDEGGVLQFLSDYRRGGWAALTTEQNGNDFLAHRLFWLGEKLLWEDLLHLFLPAGLLAHPAVYTFLMVLDDVLFMMAAIGLAVWHLQRQWGYAIALLAPSALFVASSGIGLFAGGFSECLMCLLVIVMATQLDRSSPLTLWRFVLVVVAGLGLIASKLYAAPFVLALVFLLLAARPQKILYGITFTLAPFVWLVIQSEVQRGAPSGMLNFYVNLMGSHGVMDILEKALAFFFSLSFGILPCFPLLLLATFCGKARHFALAVKIAAALGVSVILLSFPFWAGPGGLGGPRYIAPFLLIFVPEIAAGLRRLADNRRARILWWLVPASAVLFLPCLDFRNSLATRYANDPRAVTDISWPHTDLEMHPAIMGWSIVRAKIEQRPFLVLNSAANLSASVQDIFPMTGLSRVIYVLEFKGQTPERIGAVASMLEQHGLNNVQLWKILRTLLATLLLGTLAVAAWQRPSPH